MQNLTTISNVKDNVLEFNVIVDGSDSDDMTVQFIIEADEMDLTFNSEQGKEKNLWIVKVPALSMLETTSYPFRIDVLIEGYRLDAMKGSVNVIGSHDIYATAPENVTLTPSKKKRKIEDILPKKEKKTDPETKKLTPATVKSVEEPVKIEEPVKPNVKPHRKFEMQPLQVKDSKQLFKTLTADKKPERKTDDELDDKIVNLLKKAKTEQKNVQDKPKKEAKVPEKESKKESKKATTVKKENKPVTDDKQVKEPKTEKTKSKLTAKKIAGKIIESVTGLNLKKENESVVVKSNDDKIKEIITEDKKRTKKRNVPKKVQVKESTGIKKITKDNTVIEIDKEKDQGVKSILEEIDNSNTKSVTTKPFKKKDVTIH